jgi:hypothetical protein
MRPDRSGGIKACTAEIGCTGGGSKAMEPQMRADKSDAGLASCIELCLIGAARPSARPATRPVAEHHPQDLRTIRPLPLLDASPNAVP